MKLLKMNREYFIWLSLYPTDRIEGRIKYLHFAFTTALLALESIMLFSSALYIYRNLDDSIENCLFALFQVFALFCVTYMWIVAYNIRGKLINIVNKFQDIFDKSKLLKIVSYEHKIEQTILNVYRRRSSFGQYFGGSEPQIFLSQSLFGEIYDTW